MKTKLKKIYKKAIPIYKAANKFLKKRIQAIAEQQKRQLKSKRNPWATQF